MRGEEPEGLYVYVVHYFSGDGYGHGDRVIQDVCLTRDLADKAKESAPDDVYVQIDRRRVSCAPEDI